MITNTSNNDDDDDDSNNSNGIDMELELCPEAINDKLYYMDFEKWAKDFTKEISNQNVKTFQGVISMLNDEDKVILKKILE